MSTRKYRGVLPRMSLVLLCRPTTTTLIGQFEFIVEVRGGGDSIGLFPASN